MTAFIVVLCGLLFFVVLLLLPVSVRVAYSDEFKIKVKYGFITVFKSGKKKQNPEEAEENTEPEQEKSEEEKELKKDNFFKKEFKRRGVKGSIEYFGGILKDVLLDLRFFLKKIVFKVFLIDITVATENAADTGIQYGEICAVAYPVLGIIEKNAVLKLKKVNISADFDEKSYKVAVDISVSVKLIYGVILALKLFGKYRTLVKESKKNERK